MDIRLRLLRAIIFLSLCVAVAGTIAFAQTACPHGVGPGSAQCGPSVSGSSTQAPARTYVESWNWGAFVTDASVSAIGTGFNQWSRQAAIDRAMASCRELGGTKCQLALTFDSCGAIAEPTDKQVLLVPAMASDLSLEFSARKALEYCERLNPRRTCEVIWNKCNGTRVE